MPTSASSARNARQKAAGQTVAKILLDIKAVNFRPKPSRRWPRRKSRKILDAMPSMLLPGAKPQAFPMRPGSPMH